MVCKRHGDKEAVAQCAKCGAFICEDCAEETALLRDEMGTLCPDCFNKAIDEICGIYSAQRKKKMTSAIVSAVFYILGIICMSLAGAVGSFMSLIGFIMVGLYPAVAWYRAIGKSLDEHDAKHGATYVITDTGVHRDRSIWFRLVFFLLGFVFGIFVTPINIIRWLVGAAMDKKRARAWQEKRLDD